MKEKELFQAKINVRYYSRKLIRIVFLATENFPQTDTDKLGVILRKKALGISSFLAHGTAKSNKKEQNEDFLAVMAELREVLKKATISHHLKYISVQEKVAIRTAIAQVIDGLDNLVILLGGFTKN